VCLQLSDLTLLLLCEAYHLILEVDGASNRSLEALGDERLEVILIDEFIFRRVEREVTFSVDCVEEVRNLRDPFSIQQLVVELEALLVLLRLEVPQ
jgi:hypothetical protein